MTKGQKWAVVALPVCWLFGYWLFNDQHDLKRISRPDLTNNTPSQKPFSGPLFRTPASVSPSVQKVTPVQAKSLSPFWKTQLEQNLFNQGAGQLKKAEIEHVETLDWKVGNVDVKVDSVMVKLEHVKGYKSSFRAIVDSSNGKILQTWDQPTIDNFDKKTQVGIKLDPRYHND